MPVWKTWFFYERFIRKGDACLAYVKGVCLGRGLFVNDASEQSLLSAKLPLEEVFEEVFVAWFSGFRSGRLGRQSHKLGPGMSLVQPAEPRRYQLFPRRRQFMRSESARVQWIWTIVLGLAGVDANLEGGTCKKELAGAKVK
ncbi:UNVERIFIED_CONTAM: hypothetical protein Slati_1156500 [Sesamum latifolium]|uniref:Uncharacterized protein n=1 Tax=Sesamum latifolium TaxID=2727402 RepID=A0AAW2XEY7_9LAMI